MRTFYIHPARLIFKLAVLLVCAKPSPARAVIDVGSATVPSIGHYFRPLQPDPPFPPYLGFVGDLLIGGETGGATLGPVGLNLDTDTQISFTIRAPLGQKFLIEPPDGAAAFFSAPFAWYTFAAPDSGTSLGASVSFQNLVGTAPTFSSHSTVGADNQFFTFDRTSASFTSDLSFTAITLTVTYAPRATGHGTLTYQPYNPGNSTIEPRFIIGYSTSLTTDPGRFVSLVPLNGRAWDSGGTSDFWSDAGNWDPHGAPVNGDSLIFGSGARTTSHVDYPSLSVNAVAFTATAPAFTIHVPESASSRQLTITGALTNASAFEQTLIADGASGPGNSGVLTINSNALSGPFALIARGPTGTGTQGGVVQFFGAADGIGTRVITEPGTYFEFGARTSNLRLGSIEGGGQVLMGSNSLLVGYNNATTEFSGTLAGGANARLEKFGGGTLILSESNTYGGGTSVGAGILEVRAPANQLGLGDVSIHAGAQLLFSQNASAGFQTITLHGSAFAFQPGGTLSFQDTANAGRLTLLVKGAGANHAGGRVIFEEDSGAGTSSAFTVQAGLGFNGASGSVIFAGNATATGAALITNLGGASPGAQGGFTTILENATAGSATIVNESALAGLGGRTLFTHTASAGTSTLVNAGAPNPATQSFDLKPGRTEFSGNSTAGAARIANRGAPTEGGSGGQTLFRENASAGSAEIINENQALGGGGGTLRFLDAASAGTGTIVNRGALTNDDFGLTIFEAGTTAANANIFNEPGAAEGGSTVIHSSAGSANITAQGGGTFEPGSVLFQSSATAATSTLTATGATSAAGLGGLIYFGGNSTAGSAELFARSGQVAGAPGGTILFAETAEGGLARAVVEAGAVFTIGAITDTAMSIGSIEGAGTFFLGNKELVVGGNGASTTVSGAITSLPSGGALTKTGAGALTLAGLNSYAGTTRLIDGILNLDSALLDADIVVFDGVLNVNGDVTGSTIEVGSPIGTPTANLHTSQQLDSLTIGFGGVVVLDENAAPALVGLAVPEPGIGALLASALALVGVRRGIRVARSSRALVSASRRNELPDAPDLENAPEYRAVLKVREGGTPSPTLGTSVLPGPGRATLPIRVRSRSDRSPRREARRMAAF